MPSLEQDVSKVSSMDGDASNEQNLREQLEELQDQLIQAQKMASMGELSSSIAHEFNNILTTVINYAKLGLRQKDVDARTKAFDKILTAGQRAAKITTGMLSYARAGHQRKEAHSLAKLVNDVLVLVEKDLKVHRIQLSLHLDNSLYAEVNAGQIQQVLLNLIVNARQAMEDGKSMKIAMSANEDDGTVEVLVKDQGPGIPADVLPHIFERFFTTKKSDKNGQGGTGLGLAMCKDVMESHGGRIRVESAVGHGTKFTLKFPQVPAPTFGGQTQRDNVNSQQSDSNTLAESVVS